MVDLINKTGSEKMCGNNNLVNVLTTEKEMSKTNRLLMESTLVITGSLFIAIMSQLSFILPFTPVPITGQTFAVLLLAILYGGTRAGITVSAYLIEGLSGLPVFSKAGFGLVHLLGPTGGYLMGFLVSAYLVGSLADKGWSKSILKTGVAMFLGNVIIYSFGTVWLSAFIGINKAFSAGVLPFIIGDILKIMIISAVLPSAWKLLKKIS